MKRAIIWLVMLAALALPVAIATAAPFERLNKEAPDGDVAAVIRYVAEGGRIPSWAQSPTLLGDLAEEATANGLVLVVLGQGATKLPREQAAVLAALELARALASGTVVPSSVQTDWAIPVPAFDPEAALATAAALADPLPWLRTFAPSTADYARLRSALARYRAIVESGGWPAVPDGPVLKRGVADRRVPILQQRLKAEGDLASGASEGMTFDIPTDLAVRRFQARHGLGSDGSVGPETLMALNVPARLRYQEIAVNMERWRWLPREHPNNRIMINVAAASLKLFENEMPTLELRTIVGKPRYPTPVVASSIVSLLLNPPWDIPAAIVRREIRPMASRDPEYLDREGIVARDGGRRLRQLPGPKNSLGLLKFEMPNPFDIYLHDTPAQRLFERHQRFFSHGCIRVQHPLDLASRLLHDAGGWTAAELERAIANGSTLRIPLPSAMPVVIVYLTAFVDADGTVEFRDDVYGRDGPLTAALFAEPDTTGAARRESARAAVGCGPS